MAHTKKSYGANITADPRRPGKLYVKVYHAGVVYKRRAASLSHARDLVHEIKSAIARGEWPPKPEQRPALFDDLLNDYREAKRREGRAVMASNIGYTRLLERPIAATTQRYIDEWPIAGTIETWSAKGF
jgi:hypothetical protein